MGAAGAPPGAGGATPPTPDAPAADEPHAAPAGAELSPLPQSPPGAEQPSARALLRNGVRMSAAFAVNEGALLAVISLSAALVDPSVAALGNGLLYLSFSLGCIASPSLVRRLGDRTALVIGTSAYAAYVAAYIAPSSVTIPPAALAAGGCGALLWTAQGRYFTRNAHRYAHAQRLEAAGAEAPAEGAEDAAAAAAASSRAVTLFATMFAVLFPAVVAAFKAATSAALAATRGATPPVYAGLAAAALASVFAMSRVMDLRDNDDDGADGSDAHVAGDGGAAAREARRRAKPPAASSGGGGGAGGARACVLGVWGAAVASLRELRAAHREPTLLLMAPTNIAFGLCTAFFPYTVTLLAKDSLGAAAVGWLYALANVIAALAAAAFGVLLARAPGARPVIFGVGAAAFGGAAAAVFAAAPPPAPPLAAPPLAALFVAYGVGVAVWQGTCMAFFGQAFTGHAALPAFAALKLHSGLTSALAFFILPSAPPRAAAAACVAAAAGGFAAYCAAEARVRRQAARASVGDAAAEAEAGAGGARGGSELQRLL
jgi:hypothetical protein